MFSGLGATLNVAKPKKGSFVAICGFGVMGLGVTFMELVTFSKKDSFMAKKLIFCL